MIRKRCEATFGLSFSRSFTVTNLIGLCRLACGGLKNGKDVGWQLKKLNVVLDHIIRNMDDYVSKWMERINPKSGKNWSNPPNLNELLSLHSTQKSARESCTQLKEKIRKDQENIKKDQEKIRKDQEKIKEYGKKINIVNENIRNWLNSHESESLAFFLARSLGWRPIPQMELDLRGDYIENGKAVTFRTGETKRSDQDSGEKQLIEHLTAMMSVVNIVHSGDVQCSGIGFLACLDKKSFTDKVVANNIIIKPMPL